MTTAATVNPIDPQAALFDLTCRECGARCVVRDRSGAYADGWRDIRLDLAGDWWNDCGVCPTCAAGRFQEEDAPAAEPEQRTKRRRSSRSRTTPSLPRAARDGNRAVPPGRAPSLHKLAVELGVSCATPCIWLKKSRQGRTAEPFPIEADGTYDVEKVRAWKARNIPAPTHQRKRAG